ncbi:MULTISPECIES: aminotransferase class V-fold PLP-dependent enzyme [unclassified Spiroplasma]|uniref:aminotransferase class V-fold PLP-dependent enzyme n=1 Tax=unclassified Spiroplasma TaxID=2637901 RepID=UPI0027DFF9C3|nr:aminotransferase class V-fold PLP-dependent enzyme [Spiroplasma sp. AdecLV25b]
MSNKNSDFNNIKLDFPFFKKKPNLTYLDTAATSLKPQVVIDAIQEYYEKYCINTHSQDYPLAEEGNEIFEDTRKVIAQFINSDSDEVVFCPSATFAYNQIAFGLAPYLQPEDEVLLSSLEHSSLLLPFYRLMESKNIKIKFIETRSDGIITIENLKKMLTPKTRVVAFANVNNSLAIVNNTQQLTKSIKDYGSTNLKDDKWVFKNIVVVVDGAQAIGHIETDVKNWNIDFFAFSGHKIFGPTGIGVWWGKKQWLNMFQPLLLGGGMNGRIYKDGTYNLLDSPYRFEGGTQNLAGVFGLRVAIAYILNIGIKNIYHHEINLKNYAVQQLRKHIGNKIEIYNGDIKSGNLIFNIKKVFAQDVSNYLGTQNICVRSGTFCAKLLPETVNAEATVRASFYIYNTRADVDALVLALKKGINEGGDFLNEFF